MLLHIFYQDMLQAHETAHQWWGNLVAPKDWATENWISESMAEYLGALIFAGAEKNPKEQRQRN